MVWAMADLTPAARQLAEMCAPPAMYQSDVARKLGITPQAVSNWIAGNGRPGPVLRGALECLLGIPASAWMTEDERAKVEGIAPHTASDFAAPVPTGDGEAA